MSERLFSNKRIATGMAVLALAGALAEAAPAKPAGASDRAKIEATKSPETFPLIELRKKVINMLAHNKLPNRILDVAVTFSTTGYDFFTAPIGKIPDANQTPGVKRSYFIGRQPRFIEYNHANWLIFDDVQSRQMDPGANVDPTHGTANDEYYKIFIRADRLPKDFKMYTAPGEFSGHLLKAHIDAHDNLLAKGVGPNEAEILMHYPSAAQPTELVKGIHLHQTHINLQDLH
jgi:hypothetical protein